MNNRPIASQQSQPSQTNASRYNKNVVSFENPTDLTEEINALKDGEITSEDVEKYLISLINEVFPTKSEHLQIKIAKENNRHVLRSSIKLNNRQQRRHDASILKLDKIIKNSVCVKSTTTNKEHNSRARTNQHKKNVSEYLLFSSPVKVGENVYVAYLTTERKSNRKDYNTLDLYDIEVKKSG